jgi:cathepsin A (carboxypeptidase C)
MLYAGDIDMACNFIGVQNFARSLGREIKQEYTPWEYTDTSDNSIQIGGFIRQYDRLSFVSIKGAGHMVPTDLPIPAQYMIQQFINGKW